MKQSTKMGMGCLGIIFGIFVLVMVVAISSRKTPAEKANDATAGAIVKCRGYVRDQLKSPATADFENALDAKTWNLGGGKYKVSSYVDSQSGRGITVRTRFGCYVETKDGENFTVTKLERY